MDEFNPNTKVNSKYGKEKKNTQREYMVDIGDGYFIRPSLSDVGMHVAIDRYELRNDDSGNSRYRSVGYDQRLVSSKENTGAWLTLSEWEGMKKVMEPYRDPEKRKFQSKDLPISTANFDPVLPRWAFGHCMIIGEEDGKLVYVITTIRWTEGGESFPFIYMYTNHSKLFQASVRRPRTIPS
jgi:hypothetical protein